MVTDFDRRHPRGVILIRVLVTAWLLVATGILLADGYWGWALLTIAGAVANGVWGYRVYRAAMREHLTGRPRRISGGWAHLRGWPNGVKLSLHRCKIACVARRGQQVVAGDRLADRIGIGVLAKVFPPELVDRVVDEAGVREQRTRTLPARVVVYYLLAMVLFFQSGYGEVWNKLVAGLDWARRFRVRLLGWACSRARRRSR